MRYRFPRQARLTRASEFEAVHRQGEQVNVFPLRLRALRRKEGDGACTTHGEQSPGDRSRLGLCVGRQLGPAHVRTRWKAAIREAFRLHRHRLPAPYDLVASVAWESTEKDTKLVERAFLAAVDVLSSRRRCAAGPHGPS